MSTESTALKNEPGSANGAKRLLRILLVEDNENDAALLLRELTKSDYEVVHERVQTAEAMKNALDSRQWDIVISDWAMPRFSAPEALDLLKSTNADLPFVIVSGTIGEDSAVAAMRAGAHDYLAKDKLARLAPAVARELQEAEVRSERRTMHERLRISDRLVSVGILAAGVAHEINNPLAALATNLDLVANNIADLRAQFPDLPRLAEVSDELRDIGDSTTRIRSIVRDLKLFSRPEDEQRTAIDIRELLESTLRMAGNAIRPCAEIVRDYSPVPPVDANESRLGQVFLNLIVNAAQSIEEGRVADNQIRVATGVDPDGRIVVEIRDTGCGIPPEMMKRLFTPFVTTKPIGVGTGLGLSICQRIVTSFGGEIRVESEVGKGSTFRVYLLPARPRVPVLAPVAALTDNSPHTACKRGSVLVVDDEPSIGRAIRRVLLPEHDVTVVDNAQEALIAINSGRIYDAIVCDLMMPHMTGMDFHASLLQTMPEQADRMIFLTGGAFTNGARAFLDRVTNQRLEKPFDSDRLREIVRKRVQE